MNDIRYLIFGGGGAAGCAFAGALDQLANEPGFSFEQIKGVAGTSVGSIAALGVALKLSPKEIIQLLGQIDLKKFQDGGLCVEKGYRLLNHYGIYKGQALLTFILQLLREKTGRNDPENITFADLKALGYKDLHIVTTKLYKANNSPTGKQKIFSVEKTPDTSIASAILASTSAPVYFSRVRMKKISKGKYAISEDGDLYNDGGILNNYPISIFDKAKYTDVSDDPETPVINPYVLGFTLRKTYQIKKEKPNKSILTDAHLFEYAEGLINSMQHQQEDEKFNTNNLKRTIQIDRLGVKLNDFGMDAKVRQTLIESGRQAVRDYFQKAQVHVEANVQMNRFWQPAINDSNINEADLKPLINHRAG